MFLLPYAVKVYTHFEVAILTCAARVAMHPSTHPTWACVLCAVFWMRLFPVPPSDPTEPSTATVAPLAADVDGLKEAVKLNVLAWQGCLSSDYRCGATTPVPIGKDCKVPSVRTASKIPSVGTARKNPSVVRDAMSESETKV